MQILTILSKAGPRKRSWRILKSLLAVLFTLSAATVAIAQPTGTSTATLRNIFVTYGTSTSSTTGTYDAAPTTGGTTAAGNIFANTDFGSYDTNTGRLLLQGGTVQIQELNGETYDRAFIGYAVGQGTNAAGPNPAFIGTQQIELVQTGYNAGTMMRTFALSNAARNILALAAAGGTTNRFDVTVNATGTDGGGDAVSITGTGSRRKSQFTATGTASTATVNPNNIQLASDGAATPTSYYFPNTGTTPQFPGYTFMSSQNAGGVSGGYDINNGQLRLNNTVLTTTETGSNTVSSAVLYYRTRLATSGGGAFQPITLTQSGTASNGSRTFVIDPSSASNSNPQPNLIATPAVTAPGNYVVDVYYQASVVNTSTGAAFTIVYPPTGYSTANFTVSGTPIATTIWTGALNDNWFDAGNWTAGVPNASTNALVRDLGSGNNVPYPNIRSDTRYTTAGGALIYDNTNSGPAKTFNFIMGGTSQASRSIARLVVGQLQVFGDFGNSYDSFIQRENTIMEFAGKNQNITGGSFVRVDISGGGTKTLGVLTGSPTPGQRTSGTMNISEALNFLTPGVYTNPSNPLVTNPYTTPVADAGILTTDITSPLINLVVLSDRATTNFNNGAQLNGETDISYIYGFVRTTRAGVLTNENRTYGNIGMELTFFNNSPGNVEVTRNTVEAYSPGPGRFGVRRIFGVRPSDQATNSGGLNAKMVFHYRDSETVNLNGPNTITPGTGSIPEERLTIFVSSNSGNTFSLVGRDGAVDQTNNTVTRTGVTTFATFTLGDTQNPLPVKLTSFTAVRSGITANLTWTTASEQNNTGFEVQVSTNGADFRKLDFITSKTLNSTQTQQYSYSDTEAGKTATRYYRLRQIDEDGTSSFSPVRAVSFDGNGAATSLAAYPNPFTDHISLSMDAATVGDGLVRVQLMDMTGRMVSEQNVAVSNAALTMTALDGLHSGLYVVKITVPGGSTQTVRVNKL